MRKKNKKTNPELITLINDLRKVAYEKDINIWRDLANRLEKSLKNRPIVNLNRINKNINDKETALIPGKVLSPGELTKKVTIAAWSFSDRALEKIEKSGSRHITIKELMDSNPDGKNIRILG
jgi:large subunit ribosomal protein L18e